ncbi:MAG TPA: hypothetical protein DDW84_00105 [Phycisphaerales bacterium]|nr:MAG: hypothetical protein A2Y13_02050 [Planctomycetes bacterium GWC2_45_44]HBG77239.1 hypothetical protein [Phycisphaerales bacterium]HBR19204.1 hypothetical protein [Phycisphaerales bacterium]
MFLTLKIVGMTAISLAGVSLAASELNLPPYVQYGALGLAAFMVYKQFQYQEKITDQHRQERGEIVNALKTEIDKRENVVEKNTAAFDRLIDALIKKPCLKDEQLKQ